MPRKSANASLNAENLKLYEDYLAGDQLAYGKLVVNNLKLVYYFANVYHQYELSLEDGISAGMIGLMEFFRTFAEKKNNYPFSTYASLCIKTSIKKEFDRQRLVKITNEEKKKTFQTVSLNNEYRDEAITYIESLPDINANVEENYLQKEKMQEVLQTMQNLTHREKYVLINYFGLNANRKKMTIEEIANQLGFSHQYISTLKDNALQTLRLNMKESE